MNPIGQILDNPSRARPPFATKLRAKRQIRARALVIALPFRVSVALRRADLLLLRQGLGGIS